MQRINFYQPEFHPVKILLPLRQMLRVVLFLFVFVGVVTLYEFFALASLHRDITDLEDVKERQTTALQQLSSDVETRRVRPQLELQQQALAREIDSQRLLLTKLKADKKAEQKRYSAILNGLLTAASQDVWLGEISIGKGGRDVSATGTVATPRAIPAYIDALRGVDALQELPFSTLDMRRTTSDDRLQFVMGTRAGGEDASH